MLSERRTRLESELRKRLIRALRKDSSWGRLFGDFIGLIRTNHLTAYLFGGTVRDLLLSNATIPPRDLDLVVDDRSFEFFLNDFRADQIARNRFGGLKCKFNTLEIDVWPLKRTWAFQKGYRQEPSFASLPSTAFFNLDAVVAEIAPAKGKPRAIYDCGFFDGVLHQRIECNLELTEFPELNAVRGFVLAQRTGFHFSNQFCRFLFELVFTTKKTDFETVQIHHYKRIRIPSTVLEENFEQIRRLLNKAPQSTYLPRFPREIQDEFSFEADPLCFEFAR
jgi:hypothetical protein